MFFPLSFFFFKLLPVCIFLTPLASFCLRFVSHAPFCEESPKASPGLNIGARQARQQRSKPKKSPTVEAPISLEDDADVVVAPFREEHPLTKVDQRPLCEGTPPQKLGKQNL